MLTITTLQKAVLVCATVGMLLASSGRLNAGSHGPSPWNGPYKTDGNCTPRRQLYGHYAPKWTRWPGVDDAQYRSMSEREPRRYPEPPADTGPQVPPGELMLPPTDLPTLDEAPRPPSAKGGDEMGPSPLLDEEGKEEHEPSILTPPEENGLDKLEPPKTQAEQTPDSPDGAPSKSAPPDSTRPDSAPPKNTSPDSTPPATPEAKPQSPAEQPKNTPLEGNPFLDDPLFEDNAPTPPPKSSQNLPSQAPALHGPTIPARGNMSLRSSTKWRQPNILAHHASAEAVIPLGVAVKPNVPGVSTGPPAPAHQGAQQVAHWENADEEELAAPRRTDAVRENSARQLASRGTSSTDEFRVEPRQKSAEAKSHIEWRANPLR